MTSMCVEANMINPPVNPASVCDAPTRGSHSKDSDTELRSEQSEDVQSERPLEQHRQRWLGDQVRLKCVCRGHWAMRVHFLGIISLHICCRLHIHGQGGFAWRLSGGLRRRGERGLYIWADPEKNNILTLLAKAQQVRSTPQRKILVSNKNTTRAGPGPR